MFNEYNLSVILETIWRFRNFSNDEIRGNCFIGRIEWNYVKRKVAIKGWIKRNCSRDCYKRFYCIQTGSISFFLFFVSWLFNVSLHSIYLKRETELFIWQQFFFFKKCIYIYIYIYMSWEEKHENVWLVVILIFPSRNEIVGCNKFL